MSNYYDATKAKRIGTIDYYKALGVEIVTAIPDGWKVCKGALTAPKGYVWVNNQQDVFSGLYKHALLKL